MQVNCAVGSSLQSQAQRDPCARSEQGRGKEDHNRRCSAWCLARRSEPRARATPTGDGTRCRWTILCCERTLPVPSPPGWSPASGPKSRAPLTPSTDLACAASECTVTASAADDAASLERCCCSLGADGIWKHSADARSMAATSFCIISAGAQVSARLGRDRALNSTLHSQSVGQFFSSRAPCRLAVQASKQVKYLCCFD